MDWVRPLSGISLVVPYYHMVSDATVPHVSHLYRFRTISEFRSDVEFLLRHFEPVTLSDINDALNGTRPLSRPCFHLTFDDGFSEMHDIVTPILYRAGVPATFFLTTAFLNGGGLAHHNALSVLLDRLQSGTSGLGAASLRFPHRSREYRVTSCAATKTKPLSCSAMSKPSRFRRVLKSI